MTELWRVGFQSILPRPVSRLNQWPLFASTRQLPTAVLEARHHSSVCDRSGVGKVFGDEIVVSPQLPVRIGSPHQALASAAPPESECWILGVQKRLPRYSPGFSESTSKQ